ncbi:MAG: 4-phosphopantoate--beta-alanine ligase, partial [Nitrospinaceae bacterium]
LLADLRVDAAFVPSVESMYPPGYSTYVEVEGLSAHLCGAQRPGFFRGVSTVVLKLLNIVQPHTAFFGEKDRQQLAVVRRMVEDLHLDVTIEGAPIVREADGLALSSRNSYLDDGQRRSACVLHQALETARALVARGETRAEVLRRSMREHIQRQAHTKIDYVSVCDPERFTELDTIQGQALVALAVHVGKARLIDNCLVETEGCNESC